VAVDLISVGLSIMGALRSPDRWPDGLAGPIARERPDELLRRAGLADDLAGASDWLATALGPAGQGPPAELAALAAAVQPGRWPARTSAELKTLATIPGAAYPLAAADAAVLISSDTPDGLLAGLWNAIAVAGGDLGRVRFLRHPADPPGPVRGQVILARVPGLDAGQEDGFRRAMGGLGTLGRSLVHSGGLQPGEPFRFCLTGGFKATMPYLIGLAEGLRSLDAGHPVDAYVSHETAPPDAPPIRLPLRRVVASQVEQELSGFDASGRRARLPRPALLNGYAYEAHNGRCELTAFGEGLRALFGVSPERTGG
jgi:hypothetical protein